MATSVHSRAPWSAAGADTVVPIAYATGAVLLAGEAAVHVQQFAALFHAVRWVGPLFLANAVACVTLIAGLLYRPTRRLAALGGVMVSAVALGGLVVSYGQGLFGWQEAGFRTPVALTVVAEVGAVIALTLGLTAKERS
jgi:hypothetical protein